VFSRVGGWRQTLYEENVRTELVSSDWIDVGKQPARKACTVDPKGEVTEASGVHDSEAGAEVTMVDGRLDEANGRIVAGNVACGKLRM
jgi:hypothetical protein